MLGINQKSISESFCDYKVIGYRLVLNTKGKKTNKPPIYRISPIFHGDKWLNGEYRVYLEQFEHSCDKNAWIDFMDEDLMLNTPILQMGTREVKSETNGVIYDEFEW